MKLRDKSVLITGASRGIGAEIARLAAARGSRIGLLARNAADLNRLAAELGERSVAAVVAVDKVSERLGPIDVVVANAGVGLYGTFLDADVDDLDRVLRTNYLGVVHV